MSIVAITNEIYFYGEGIYISATASFIYRFILCDVILFNSVTSPKVLNRHQYDRVVQCCGTKLYVTEFNDNLFQILRTNVGSLIKRRKQEKRRL